MFSSIHRCDHQLKENFYIPYLKNNKKKKTKKAFYVIHIFPPFKEKNKC